MKEKIMLISEIKKYFESTFEKSLFLTKVQSPLFVSIDSGLQDDLSGKEESVKFKKGDETFEIVHSLAKWKREALYKYGFDMHTGLYTDMKAIRKDEEIDDIHSLFVEQYDYEIVISKEDRTEEYLRETVEKIYKVLLKTYKMLVKKDEYYKRDLPKKVYFITSEDLLKKYPKLTPKEREEKIVREKHVVFISHIGYKLEDGIPHDLRSPDYDDWKLDGDLLIYDEVYDRVIELSSMGIRVDSVSLKEQLEYTSKLDKLKLDYHKKVMKGIYPLTLGGGIGISRILLFLLKAKHIKEVQASSWPKYVDSKKSL